MEQATQEGSTATQEPNYEAMSIEQLRSEAFPNGDDAAPAQQATDTAQDTQAAQTEGQDQQQAANEPPAWFKDWQKNFETNQKRELGSYRDLNRFKDNLPKLLQELEHRLTANRAQQTTNPDEQQAQLQQAEQQKLLQGIIQQTIQGAYGPQVELLQQLADERKDSQYLSDVFSMVQGKVPDAQALWQDIWKDNAEKIEAGDAQAIAWHERALKEPSLVAWEMLMRQSNKVQAQGQQFTQDRAQASAKAAQRPQGNAVSNQAKKALNEMSQKELDGLSTEELRRRTLEEGHFAE